MTAFSNDPAGTCQAHAARSACDQNAFIVKPAHLDVLAVA
jgi:hypothetical protein